MRRSWKGLGSREAGSRLLIGKEETNTAIEEGWYKTKPGVGSQLLVRYTEESRTVTEQKEIEKVIRGGSQLSVEDGKQMMVGAMASTYSQGMLGIDSPQASDDEEPPAPVALGVRRLPAPAEHPRKPAVTASPQLALQPAVTPPSKRVTAKDRAAEKEAAKQAAKDQQFPHGCVNQWV